MRPADAVLGLQYACVEAALLKTRRCGQAGEPRTDHHDFAALGASHSASIPHSAGRGAPGRPDRQQSAAQ